MVEMQEAVEKLLQKFQAMYGEAAYDLSDREFLSFTSGSPGRMQSHSFSLLSPRLSNTVHPTSGSPSKSTARRSLRHGSTGSKPFLKLPILAKVASMLKLAVPSATWSSQSMSMFSSARPALKTSMQSTRPLSPEALLPVSPKAHDAASSNSELSMHSVGLSSPKHRLPAKRASILKLGTVTARPSHEQHADARHTHSALSMSALRLKVGSSTSSIASQRPSWLNLSQNAVHPLPVSHADEAATTSGQALLHASSTRGRLEVGAHQQLAADMPAQEAQGLIASRAPYSPRPGGILRTKSSLTAASMFDNALDASSLEDDSSQVVPDDLVEAAMFMLRDKTLADPQAEVNSIA